jgi:hypothetical protein
MPENQTGDKKQAALAVESFLGGPMSITRLTHAKINKNGKH